MARLLRFIASSVILFIFIECKTLPKYMKKCSLKSADEFTKCAVEVGNAAMKEFIHGDKEYKILNLVPLELPSLELNTAGLKLTLTNVVVKGMDNIEVKSMRYDKNSKKLFLDTYLDKLEIEGQYKVDGKIMVLPISGAGHGKLDFLDGSYSYVFDINTVKKDGREVIKVGKPELKAKFGGAKFHLDNLFNGNDQLGEETNKFLNENWNEIIKEFNSLVVTPMAEIVHGVFSGFLDNLTYDEVFADL